MNLNSITTDRSSSPQLPSARIGGGESFQIAYARVYDGRYAPGAPPLASDGVLPAPPEQLGAAKNASAAHTVHAGETLTAIARARIAALGAPTGAAALRESIAQLAKANNIRNPDRIYAGQKLDLAALDNAFSRHQAAATQATAVSAPHEEVTSSYGSAHMVARYEVFSQAPWRQEDMLPAENIQLAAGAPAPLPAATPPVPPADAMTAIDRPATALLPSIDPAAARQVALYEQNAAAVIDKPADPARTLPDIVYKGVTGKVLDALPMEPSTRVNLQRASSIVSSTFTARSLGALTGFGGPFLTIAGLLWGVFSSRQIEATSANEEKPVPESNPVADAKATQTTVADALN